MMDKCVERNGGFRCCRNMDGTINLKGEKRWR